MVYGRKTFFSINRKYICHFDQLFLIYCFCPFLTNNTNPCLCIIYCVCLCNYYYYSTSKNNKKRNGRWFDKSQMPSKMSTVSLQIRLRHLIPICMCRKSCRSKSCLLLMKLLETTKVFTPTQTFLVLRWVIR